MGMKVVATKKAPAYSFGVKVLIQEGQPIS